MDITLGNLTTIIENLQTDVENLKNIIRTLKKDDKEYMSTVEAAKFLKTTPNALRQRVFAGKIKNIKQGRSLIFLKSELIEYLESGKRESKDDIDIDILV